MIARAMTIAWHLAKANRRSSRCVWVETQTVNYGAVQFYRSMGFEWCGFDTSLYDPSDAGVDEVLGEVASCTAAHRNR